MRLLMLLGWALAFLGTADSNVIFGKVGGDIVLKPGDFSGKSILWKYGEDLAVLWDGAEIEYYQPFKGRSELNLENGEFTIKKLTLADTNSYTPEVNNVLRSKIELKVLRSVPTPSITETNYNFLCNGDTRDAEPVTYSWTLNNEMLELSSKEIYVEDYKCPEATFTCTIRNPVSEMRSAEYSLCLPPPDGNHKTLIIVIVVIIVVLLIVVVVVHKVITKEWFFEKDGMCWTAEFWKDTTGQPVNHNDAGAGEHMPMAKP